MEKKKKITRQYYRKQAKVQEYTIKLVRLQCGKELRK
jgi:hypothetical protein